MMALACRRLVSRNGRAGPTRTTTIAETYQDPPFDPDTHQKYPRYLLDLAETHITARDVSDFIDWYEERHPAWKCIIDYDRHPFWLVAVRRDLEWKYH